MDGRYSLVFLFIIRTAVFLGIGAGYGVIYKIYIFFFFSYSAPTVQNPSRMFVFNMQQVLP